METFIKNPGLANIIFRKFLVMSKKNTGPFIKFNYEYNHSQKKRIVWKHGPNGPFYTLMLRTKLY